MNTAPPPGAPAAAAGSPLAPRTRPAPPPPVEPPEAWLVTMERRVILPVKWVLLVMVLLYWYVRQPIPAPPEAGIFGVFIAYLMANLGHSYFCLASNISRRQARPFSLASLAVDVAFLVTLAILDARTETALFDANYIDFYIFFCVVVLRGLSVLRSPLENVLYGLVLAVALIGSIRVLEASFAFLADSRFIFRFALVWVVFAIGWFLIASIRRAQEENAAMRESLLLRENLAYLGEVSAGVAHEVNNPIAIITACADSLARMLPPGDELHEEVEMIRAEARRCKRIVQDLLGFAAPQQAIEVALVDARALADDQLVPLATRDWSPPPRILREYAAELPLLHGDPVRLGQALRNVLINAYQHMGPRGRLTVAVGRAERNGRAMVLLRVADTGPGIDPEAMRHLFEPFATRRRGGTGLGLAIAARIVAAHQGHIDVATSAEGTAMTLLLPAADRAAPAYAARPLPGAAALAPDDTPPAAPPPRAA